MLSAANSIAKSLSCADADVINESDNTSDVTMIKIFGIFTCFYFLSDEKIFFISGL